MKITNWAILFVCIFIPFFLIMDFRTSDLESVSELNHQYTIALRTAAQDAGVILSMNEMQEYETEYRSIKFFKVNKELAIDTFFMTLYLNFGVERDPIGQGALAAYVPAIVVLDYDGYYLYTMTEYTDTNGEIIYKHMWRPKKPYAFADSAGNSINFTLDEYVHAYDATTQKWVQGFRYDLQGQTYIPLLNDESSFETLRKSIIVKSIQDDLAYFINKHNEYATRNGIHYSFKLPEIAQEDWVNSINDIGIMAFIQGIPVGDQYYNSYAFGGGRLMKKVVINGGIDDTTGLKYYYQSDCAYSYRVEEKFDSKKDAAAEGYYPRECVR